jgi:hypothetical protein
MATILYGKAATGVSNFYSEEPVRDARLLKKCAVTGR